MIRTNITRNCILRNNFDKDKEYILKDRLDLSLTSILYFESLEINLLVRYCMILKTLPHLKTISKNIIVGGEIRIKECPLLKSIPIEVTSNKIVRFAEGQHLTTLFSEEQFLSLKGFYLSNDLTYSIKWDSEITSYEEYFSLIEPTLIKNNLLNICL